MRSRTVLPAVALALLTSSSARANEADAYGLGSRASAMGGAVVADAADFSGNYYNPAALVGAPGLSLSIGYTFVQNNLSIDGHDSGVANVHGLVGGIVAPGKVFGIPFAFGIGTYIPDSGLSSIQALRQEVPRWALYDGRASILFLAANLAVRPVSWLEIGGGLAFLAATKGQFSISGVADILHPYNSKLRHEVDADLTSVRYPQVGARVKIGPWGYVGIAYRGQTKLDLSINALLAGNIDAFGALIPLQYNLATHTVDAFLPQQVAVGVSFQKVRNLKINVDVTFVNWSAYESPTAATTAHLALTGAPPSLMLPADPQPTVVIPPQFEDRFVPRIGVEYILPVAGAPRDVKGHEEQRRLVEIPFRVGYVYERSPVPPQTGVTNFVDADRHTVSLGTGLAINAPGSVLTGSLKLDVHGQLSVLPQRITLKSDAADFIGDYRASGTMLGIGSTLTAEF